eukprot:2295472-Rhodomonas_salina.5
MAGAETLGLAVARRQWWASSAGRGVTSRKDTRALRAHTVREATSPRCHARANQVRSESAREMEQRGR